MLSFYFPGFSRLANSGEKVHQEGVVPRNGEAAGERKPAEAGGVKASSGRESDGHSGFDHEHFRCCW